MQNLYYNLEAEQAILGILLTTSDPLICSKIYSDLPDIAFWDPANQSLYLLLKKMNKDSLPTDVITVPENAKKQGLNIPEEHILQIASNCSTTSNYEYYIDIIKENWTRQRLASFKEKINSETDPYTPINELFAIYQSELNNIIQETESDKIKGFGDDVMEVLEQGIVPRMFFTGFEQFDELVSFEPEKLVILSGDPALGKTSLCLQYALEALRQKKKVFFISLEMSRRTIIYRLASIFKQKSVSFIVQEQSLLGELTQFHDKLLFDWGQSRNVEQITRQNMIFGADLIIIDSETQLDTKERTSDEHHSKILKDLKRLSMEQHCMVLMICRMNRDRKTGEKPSMTFLKGSSSFEYEADIIYFLYNNGNEKTDVSFLIVKNREGPVGEIQCEFVPNVTTFKEKR
jgi:replicative DNA helicase